MSYSFTLNLQVVLRTDKNKLEEICREKIGVTKPSFCSTGCLIMILKKYELIIQVDWLVHFEIYMLNVEMITFNFLFGPLSKLKLK